MRIDTSFVTQVFPLIRRLPQTLPDWHRIQGLPALSNILENGRVVEDGNRGLTLHEWISMWMAAASHQSGNGLGQRQTFMFDNMCTTVQHIEELERVIGYLLQNSASLGEEIEARVRENLPRGAVLPDAITMVLGTTSSGFVDDTGIYVDLVTLYMFFDQLDTIRRLLTHESWHFGHGTLLEKHPHRNEPWFLPLAQLQSEGVVNYLIGGTYEINVYRSKHSEGPTKRQSKRFVEYADSMAANRAQRLAELFSNLEKLMEGNVDGYTRYIRTLPDMPGYLHGVVMARAIDEVFGREALISSTLDPLEFIVLSAQAFRVQGSNIGLTDGPLRHWTRLCIR